MQIFNDPFFSLHIFRRGKIVECVNGVSVSASVGVLKAIDSSKVHHETHCHIKLYCVLRFVDEFSNAVCFPSVMFVLCKITELYFC